MTINATSSTATFTNTSIYSYLEHQQSQDDLDELFSSPWCVLAVFQSLDSLAQQIVLRLLPIKSFVSRHFLQTWVVTTIEGINAFESSLKRLIALNILGTTEDETTDPNTTVPRVLDIHGLQEQVLVRDAFGMHKIFRTSLQKALTSAEQVPWEAQTLQLPPVVKPPTSEEIERHATERWNIILHFLLGSVDAPIPDKKMIELLVSTKLLAPGRATDSNNIFTTDEDDEEEDLSISQPSSTTPSTRLTFQEIVNAGGGAVHITKSGYSFLLRDTAVQLWTFIHEYLRTGTTRGSSLNSILGLLFELGLCRLGEGYAISALTPLQQSLLSDFAAFGLVYIPAGQVSEYQRFYPTSLAIVLTHPETTQGSFQDAMTTAAMTTSLGTSTTNLSDVTSSSTSSIQQSFNTSSTTSSFTGDALLSLPSSGRMHIIVEKNFKVYAYTDVALHISLLSLFAQVDLRLPNVVVATLTRRSVLAAMEKGISASDIYHFLAIRVHPMILLNGPPLPENVADQIYLWEMEKKRVKFTSSIMLSGFESDTFFLDSERYAREKLHAVLWSSLQRRELVLKDSVIGQMQKWMLSYLHKSDSIVP